jgi:outer membrane lipoprotein-sorting protein
MAVVAAAIVSVRIDPQVVASSALQRSRDVYASLRSYSDVGTVDYEFGPAASRVRERHRFTTYFRAPRHFYFDFVKQQNVDRFVVWSDDEAFHSFWQQPGLTETYPKGQGATAFVTGWAATTHSITVIAPLLFSQARLTGTLTELVDAKPAGTEMIDGHECQKIVGTAKSVYQATGHESNVRATTVWIDTKTLLVRRVFEDTPQGGPAGVVSRLTTTIEPEPNPALDDSRFTFTPPGRGK